MKIKVVTSLCVFLNLIHSSEEKQESFNENLKKVEWYYKNLFSNLVSITDQAIKNQVNEHYFNNFHFTQQINYLSNYNRNLIKENKRLMQLSFEGKNTDNIYKKEFLKTKKEINDLIFSKENLESILEKKNKEIKDLQCNAGATKEALEKFTHTYGDEINSYVTNIANSLHDIASDKNIDMDNDVFSTLERPSAYDIKKYVEDLIQKRINQEIIKYDTFINTNKAKKNTETTSSHIDTSTRKSHKEIDLENLNSSLMAENLMLKNQLAQLKENNIRRTGCMLHNLCEFQYLIENLADDVRNTQKENENLRENNKRLLEDRALFFNYLISINDQANAIVEGIDYVCDEEEKKIFLLNEKNSLNESKKFLEDIQSLSLLNERKHFSLQEIADMSNEINPSDKPIQKISINEKYIENNTLSITKTLGFYEEENKHKYKIIIQNKKNEIINVDKRTFEKKLTQNLEPIHKNIKTLPKDLFDVSEMIINHIRSLPKNISKNTHLLIDSLNFNKKPPKDLYEKLKKNDELKENNMNDEFLTLTQKKENPKSSKKKRNKKKNKKN
jgi:hypothetical protein